MSEKRHVIVPEIPRSLQRSKNASSPRSTKHIRPRTVGTSNRANSDKTGTTLRSESTPSQHEKRVASFASCDFLDDFFQNCRPVHGKRGTTGNLFPSWIDVSKRRRDNRKISKSVKFQQQNEYVYKLWPLDHMEHDNKVVPSKCANMNIFPGVKMDPKKIEKMKRNNAAVEEFQLLHKELLTLEKDIDFCDMYMKIERNHEAAMRIVTFMRNYTCRDQRLKRLAKKLHKAAIIVQNFMRSSFFKCCTTKKRRSGSKNWMFEVVMNSIISKTSNCTLICKSLHMCLSMEKYVLVKKTLTRVSIMAKSIDTRKVLLDSIPLQLLVGVLNCYISKPLLTGMGMDILIDMLRSPSNCSTTQEIMRDAGANLYVTVAVKQHIADSKLCFKAASLINRLAKGHSSSKDTFFSIDAMKIVAKVLRKQAANFSVCFNVVRAARSMCENHDSNICAACDSGACALMMHQLVVNELFISDKDLESLIKFYVMLLSSASHAPTANKIFCNRAFLKVIVKKFLKHYSSVNIYAKICSLIRMLVESGTPAVKDIFLECGMCEAFATLLSSCSVSTSPAWRLTTIPLIPLFATGLCTANNEVVANICSVLEEVSRVSLNKLERKMASAVVKIVRSVD